MNDTPDPEVPEYLEDEPQPPEEAAAHPEVPRTGLLRFARMAGSSIAGREAQHAFWGQGDIEPQSMLHQLAKHVAARGAGPA